MTPVTYIKNRDKIVAALTKHGGMMPSELEAAANLCRTTVNKTIRMMIENNVVNVVESTSHIRGVVLPGQSSEDVVRKIDAAAMAAVQKTRATKRGWFSQAAKQPRNTDDVRGEISGCVTRRTATDHGTTLIEFGTINCGGHAITPPRSHGYRSALA